MRDRARHLTLHQIEILRRQFVVALALGGMRTGLCHTLREPCTSENRMLQGRTFNEKKNRNVTR